MKDLIDELFDKFEKDKKDIKESLLNNLNVIVLQKYSDYETVKMIITCERRDD